MIRALRILLCIVSVLVVVMAEHPELDYSTVEPSNSSKHLLCFAVLASVCFLHWQLYQYVLPKALRARLPSSNHYHYSFFRGTIGLGYFFVLIHISDIYMSQSSSLGWLYTGLFLIFCGALSKVKGVIAEEFQAMDEN